VLIGDVSLSRTGDAPQQLTYQRILVDKSTAEGVGGGGSTEVDVVVTGQEPSASHPARRLPAQRVSPCERFDHQFDHQLASLAGYR
jgi:hypothetical protein